MYNKVILFGRLTKDINLKRIKDFIIGESTIVTNRIFKNKNRETKEENMFIDITFYRKDAENAAKFFSKGSRILIEGRLKLQKWVAADGVTKTKYSIDVESYKVIDFKEKNIDNNTNIEADEEVPF